MAKIKQILLEVEDRLASGEKPEHIAEKLHIPLHWVTEAEMDMDWTYCNPDYSVGEL